MDNIVFMGLNGHVISYDLKEFKKMCENEDELTLKSWAIFYGFYRAIYYYMV